MEFTAINVHDIARLSVSMIALMKGRAAIALVAAFLFLQCVLLWLGINEHSEISIFCTGPRSSSLGLLFGLIHLLFLGLLFLGVLSLRLSVLRFPYICLLVAGLMALPAQASLVERHQLSCDAP